LKVKPMKLNKVPLLKLKDLEKLLLNVLKKWEEIKKEKEKKETKKSLKLRLD
jgi:hypothetical protein